MRIFRTASPVVLLALATLSACSDEVVAPTEAPDGAAARYTAPVEPVNGEFIRVAGTSTVYMVYDRVLYGVPDPQTLRACTGGHDRVVREVSSLPAWQTRTLPSAGDEKVLNRANNWMFGDQSVKAATGDGTMYVIVGCVRSGIPNPETYQAIFNDPAWARQTTAPHDALMALPAGPVASPMPLRRAGSLVESGGTIRWVTSHGASLGVPDPQTMDSYCRPWSEMISSSGEFGFYQEKWALQAAPTSSCPRGKDYPYSGYSMDAIDQWNFYYRNCTSFAAWRLNQDGINFSNQYALAIGDRWSHAMYWDDAAARAKPAAGFPITVNRTPRRGAIAQWNAWSTRSTGYGHVAYVSAVHNDGTITIEEYNYATTGGYSTTRIAASSVDNFIHFR